MSLTLFGDVTPQSVIHKFESHKLMQAFPVATGKPIGIGQLVVLLDDGTIRGYEAVDAVAATLRKPIGFAITSSTTPAYGESKQHGAVDVTVCVKGFAITYGIAKTDVVAGPIVPTGDLDTTKRYAAYSQGEADTELVAYALNPADAGELLQVLIL